MEGISTNNTTANNVAPNRQKSTSVQSPYSLPDSLNAQDISHKISSMSLLSRKVSSSSDDVRAEAMERARQLLEDPNWPNDVNLSKLSEKIIDEENL
jgi:hypothetical protein